MSSAEVTRDHDVIKSWITKRGGKPAIVEGTEDNRAEAGVLRVKFDDSQDNLVETDWQEFFETFEKRGLSFLYQDNPPDSHFFKFIKQ